MLNYIDVELDDLVEELFDAKDIIEQYRNLVDSSDYILKGQFYGGESNGTFDDCLWVSNHHITKGNIYFDFKPLEELRFIGVDSEYIGMVKSWVADMLETSAYTDDEDGELIVSIDTVSKYNYLVDFIKRSQNFSKDFIDDTKGSEFNEYFSISVKDATKNKKARAVYYFIEFTGDWFFEKFKDIGTIYHTKLQIRLEETSDKSDVRILPDSKNIILFDTCLKDFFDKEEDYNLKMYYYPLLIWWKLTTVIPFRPSEFCLKIKRDCLETNENGYFIKIDRLKRKRGTKPNLLPVLRHIKITEEMHDLISDYINKTSEFGESKTLISIPALLHFRLQAKEFFECTKSNETSKSCRYFTNARLTRLIQSFYSKVIETRYKYMNITQRIKPHDTRHFAFTSLVMQGFSAVEIAIIGGHRSLSSLDTYTSSGNTYIDTEVIVAITKGISEGTIDKISVKQLVFGMSEKSKINLNSDYEVEIDNIKLGYCTANFNTGTLPCEDSDCFNCTKWWCAPTEKSYNTLIGILSKRIASNQTKLNRDMGFMKQLIDNTMITVINENPILNKQDEKGLKSVSLRLNSTCRKIIDLKTRLINPDIVQNMVVELCDNNSYITESSIFTREIDLE
ncbi:site-specific integrase [Clostridium perfringens]|uniref:site-specific integrase n=1 Tax=Clostridium perfringens TaxID=1502 RepID=UPI002341C742|nr:site-specific integrase [Clostridium perfringens]MDC4243915.1 site-specific integrase [Clostridium perfringens]